MTQYQLREDMWLAVMFLNQGAHDHDVLNNTMLSNSCSFWNDEIK